MARTIRIFYQKMSLKFTLLWNRILHREPMRHRLKSISELNSESMLQALKRIEATGRTGKIKQLGCLSRPRDPKMTSS